MSRYLMILSLLSAAWLHAADEGGTVTGVVASKGDTWLGVKAEGQEDPSLYMPYWKGTGFDNEMLMNIRKIDVGSKVKLVWKSDEHPRIVSVEVLAPPEKPVVAEKRPEKHFPERPDRPGEKMIGDRERVGEKERIGEKERMIEREKERMGEKERMIAEREKEKKHHGEKSSLTGVVMSKGDAFIEVKVDEKTPAEKYFPRYVVEEGGPDREMLKIFQKLKVGEWIKMDYTQDERRRALKIERAAQQ